METVEANITVQEKVVLVEAIEVQTDQQEPRCLTQSVPSAVPIAKFLSGQMAEKKFSAVNVLRKWVVESPATQEDQVDLRVEVTIDPLGTDQDSINLCSTLSVTNAETTVSFPSNQETVNRYFVVIVLQKKKVEETTQDLFHQDQHQAILTLVS